MGSTRTFIRPAAAPASPPEIAVIERTGADRDGFPLARPVGRRQEPSARMRIVEAGSSAALPVGGRAVARLVRRESGAIEAQIIRRLDAAGERIVGVFYRRRQGGELIPADRRNRTEYHIDMRDSAGATDGELVVAEPLAAGRLGAPRARIAARLGLASDPGVISLIAIASGKIPTEFPPAVIAEASAAKPADPMDRIDLRHLPLVTIDGSDARDFDDAVWAEADPDPTNADGWHLVVAIADVAWYVPAGSAVDREAERRGNSVYFPDRVVPMLPEALSNELCSLQPNVDRACVAVHLWVDGAGCKIRHRFERAIVRSAARLTYEQVQAAHDAVHSPPEGVLREVVAPLYGAFAALARARMARGALELDLAEDRIVLDAEKRPLAVVPAARLDSHRLIEEFMILANVAAAEELEARRQACIFRVHDAPDPEKLAALRDLLNRMGLAGLDLAKGQAPQPELFNRLLRRAAATSTADLVSELVLRCQAQAAYSPHNIGHYGLALRHYVHFTSPIRRYADLVVHRALTAGSTGPAGATIGPPPVVDRDRLVALGEHVSATERRAAAAERAAVERYRAALMAPSVGRRFAARITGVAEFGLFVTTSENRAGGLVPISTLPADYYEFDRKSQRLIGRSSGTSFGLGDAVAVRLAEADAVSGRLVFRMQDEGSEVATNAAVPRRATGHAGRSRSGDRRRG
jgi:ribonuclease R